jgi:hypothetical protein
MADARRSHRPGSGRPAANPDSGSGPSSPTAATLDLAELRAIAMRLARRLEAMLPPLESDAAGADVAATAAPATPAQAAPATPAQAAPAAPAQAGRADPLLGKGGIIDGFVALAGIVVRIVDQERRLAASLSSSKSEASGSHAPGSDPGEQPLGRRVTLELDRLAARLRAPGVREAGDPLPGG